MKKIIAVLLMMEVLMCGCGSSNKSDAELKDIEQFKCQDSIQTVFDVFGESEMEDNAYIGECYTYEDINLYGYNGKATFRVRDDKKTIAKFECSFELNKNEFEDVLSQLSNKYGEYEKNEYSNQIAYVWKIPEEMAGEMGYNQICLSDYGDKKAIIDFTDEWSIKTDEAYYEYLNGKEMEEEKETSNESESSSDDINVLFQKEYEVDGEKINISMKGNEGNVEINIFGNAKDEEKASIMLACFKKSLSEISIDGYSITIKTGEASVIYKESEGNNTLMGTNKDGSIAFSAPDWIVTEFKMTEEEMNSFTDEIINTMEDFGESAEMNN